MAIVKMKKFRLLVLDSYREKLLRELQIFRNVQFEDVVGADGFEYEKFSRFKRPINEESILFCEERMNQCTYAIDLIHKYTSQISGIKGFIEGLPNYTFEEMEEKSHAVDFEKKYSAIKKLGDNLAKIESNISKRRDLIKELEPIIGLDVDFSSLDNLKKYNSIVGGVSGKLVDAFNESLLNLKYTYYEEIGVHKDEHYFLIISDKEDENDLNEALRVGNFNRIKLDLNKIPSESIKELSNEIDELDKEKEETIKNIRNEENNLKIFKLLYEYYGNLKVRLLAQNDFMSTASVCILKGYIPEFDIIKFEKIIDSVSNGAYSLELEDVDKDSEDVPIMLKNNRLVRVFENVTATYALPKYNEIDPTPLYAPIYALFFGMMSADFGYGAVLLLLTTMALHLCNLTPDMKKNVKFFQLIGISTAVWGFLYGSYFGASIPGVWRLFDLSKQFMDILIISIIMGGIHLFYGLGIKAYMQIRDGKPLDMFFDVVSWYITLISIICLLLSVAGILDIGYKRPAMYGMIVGFLLLIIGGARTSTGGIGQKLVAGLYNVYGISNYIGDFVSYSRLMALGMAGGYIAFSVNMIAGMAWGNGIIGSVAAIIILVFFHAFNLFLSCLGAYVHALRLIYVEFFGKFYEGGGKAFKFFRNKTKYINLDRHYED